jgi:solute carrier family 25, member 39/40
MNKMAVAIPSVPTSLASPPQNTGQNLTALQKSISAISGAFLTSLLVTPLDVVRVRLQSQQPSSNPILNPLTVGIPPRLGYSTLGTEGPSGLTACCKEVFFSRGWSVSGNHIQCSYIPFDSPAMENVFCAAEETGKKTFTGTWEGLVKIARYEGASSLWRGLSPTL